MQRDFSHYILKVSQVKGSFYVLIRRQRGKSLGENLKNMFDGVKYISEKMYKKFSDKSNRFRYNFYLTLNWSGVMEIIGTIF